MNAVSPPFGKIAGMRPCPRLDFIGDCNTDILREDAQIGRIKNGNDSTGLFGGGRFRQIEQSPCDRVHGIPKFVRGGIEVVFTRDGGEGVSNKEFDIIARSHLFSVGDKRPPEIVGGKVLNSSPTVGHQDLNDASILRHVSRFVVLRRKQPAVGCPRRSQ